MGSWRATGAVAHRPWREPKSTDVVARGLAAHRRISQRTAGVESGGRLSCSRSASRWVASARGRRGAASWPKPGGPSASHRRCSRSIRAGSFWSSGRTRRAEPTARSGLASDRKVVLRRPKVVEAELDGCRRASQRGPRSRSWHAPNALAMATVVPSAFRANGVAPRWSWCWPVSCRLSRRRRAARLRKWFRCDLPKRLRTRPPWRAPAPLRRPRLARRRRWREWFLRIRAPKSQRASCKGHGARAPLRCERRASGMGHRAGGGDGAATESRRRGSCGAAELGH